MEKGGQMKSWASPSMVQWAYPGSEAPVIPLKGVDAPIVLDYGWKVWRRDDHNRLKTGMHHRVCGPATIMMTSIVWSLNDIDYFGASLVSK